MTVELLGKFIALGSLYMAVCGSIYAFVFYLPERLARAKNILRKISSFFAIAVR